MEIQGMILGCDECGALVDGSMADRHLEWHEEIRESLENRHTE